MLRRATCGTVDGGLTAVLAILLPLCLLTKQRQPCVDGGALPGRQPAGILLELIEAAFHQQIRRGGHGDLLQESIDHLRGNWIRFVRQQLNGRSTTREAAARE